MDSILISIKKMLGIDETDEAFDLDLILLINAQFSVLYQLGVGRSGFTITGSFETWDNYLSDFSNLEMIKAYIAIRVRLLFDPPTSSFVLDALKAKADEYEWRINVAVDPAVDNVLRS